MSRTTKSATEFAKTTYDAARRAFPDFSGPFSPRKFTQPQIVTMLALRQFFKLDYRGTTQRLAEWKELRDTIEIGERVPHFTTLIHAEKRLLKKMPSLACST
jgi:hypothetical protein